MSDFDPSEFTKVAKHIDWTPVALTPVEREAEALPPRAAEWFATYTVQS